VKTINLTDEQLASMRRCGTLEIDDELTPLIDVQFISSITDDGPEPTPTVLRITQRKPQQVPPLRPEHAKMIASEGDRNLLEILYSLPKAIKQNIDNTYKAKVLKDYNTLELEWLKVEKYLLGLRLGHAPSEQELMADMDQERLTLHFRVYYALTKPGAVERINRKD
jgi:hypothetical protein